MTTINEFVNKIESNYNVKVIDYKYETFIGWNPLKLKMNQIDLLKFISKYGYSGTWLSAQYSVAGNEITFYSSKGNDIISML